jgi:nucleoporin NUP42
MAFGKSSRFGGGGGGGSAGAGAGASWGSTSASASSSSSHRACTNWARDGTCRFGSSCKFSHSSKGGEGGGGGGSGFGHARQSSSQQGFGRVGVAGGFGNQNNNYNNGGGGGGGFGSGVKKSHQQSQDSSASSKSCTNWTQTGSCRFGSKCKFNHSTPTSSFGGGVTSFGAFAGSNMQSSSQSTFGRSTDFGTVGGLSLQGGHAVHGASTFGRSGTAFGGSSNVPQQSQSSSISRSPCTNWVTSGNCRFGSRCKFSHSSNGEGSNLQQISPSRSPPCRSWDRDGSCRFGSNCRFVHATRDAEMDYGDNSSVSGGGSFGFGTGIFGSQKAPERVVSGQGLFVGMSGVPDQQVPTHVNSSPQMQQGAFAARSAPFQPAPSPADTIWYTDEEMEAFKASEFQIGRIPEVEPPATLCL